MIWNIWNSVANPIPIQRIVEFRATGSATNDDVEDNPNPDRQAVGVVYFYSLFRVVHGSHPWAGGASQGLFLFSLFFVTCKEGAATTKFLLLIYILLN